MPDQPVIVSPGMMTRALADQGFYQHCPEFIPLKAMMAAMRTSLQQVGGCGGCRKRRVEHNLYGAFLQQLVALSPEAVQRFKLYMKVGQIMLNCRDNTGKVTAKIL